MKKVLGIMSIVLMIFSCADYDLLDEKPESVNCTVSDVQDSSVTLRWTQSSDENFKSYKVYYDTSDHLGRFVDSTLFVQDTTQIIKNLIPATAYYFAVFVTNQGAKSSMSNIASTVTWLRFLPQEGLGDWARVLKWNRPRGFSATGYHLFSDTSSSVDTLDTLEAQLGVNDTSFYLSDVPYDLTLNLRVFARGTGGYITGSTTAQIKGWWFPQHEPVQVSDSSVFLSWAPVNGVQQYRVFGSTASPVDTSDTPCGTFGATDSSATVIGLVQGTRYYFKVYAINTSGFFAWTQETSDSLL